MLSDEIKTFQSIIKEIHRVNQGWHCFEAANRFMGTGTNYFQSIYLKQKNMLQKRLLDEYEELIIIQPPDETGFSSIKIKEPYQFETYKDACHMTTKGDLS